MSEKAVSVASRVKKRDIVRAHMTDYNSCKTLTAYRSTQRRRSRDPFDPILLILHSSIHLIAADRCRTNPRSHRVRFTSFQNASNACTKPFERQRRKGLNAAVFAFCAIPSRIHTRTYIHTYIIHTSYFSSSLVFVCTFSIRLYAYARTHTHTCTRILDRSSALSFGRPACPRIFQNKNTSCKSVRIIVYYLIVRPQKRPAFCDDPSYARKSNCENPISANAKWTVNSG
jgi:hypothetical protein